MENKKWYENTELDNSIIISSRVRLARNLNKYRFNAKMKQSEREMLIQDVKNSIINDRTPVAKDFTFIDMKSLSELDKQSMFENHIISYGLMNSDAAVIVNKDCSVSIMINEEDHIRIQSMLSGFDIEKALETAHLYDKLIGESVSYAYSEKYGYLTSCLTNAGTGLRASFMLHLPLLEAESAIEKISRYVNKFGLTIRGIFGEGSKPLGAIYQISNQITLGKSEKEIISVLKSVTKQIIKDEQRLREQALQSSRIYLLNDVCRARGVLANCKVISSKEAMERLSDVRFGYLSGLLEKPELKSNIYDIMMKIQYGNIQKLAGKKLTEEERDIKRAEYLNSIFA